MTNKLLITAGSALALLAPGAASAHHSNSMFDRTKVVKLDGTVKDFQWTNPHIWIQLLVPSASGQTEYSIEGPSPSILRRKGWKFNVLKTGDKATVFMHPLRTGQLGGGVMSIVVNGQRYDYEPPAPVSAS